jgi:threonine/homoserine/homoserine lactone efflux protein
MAWLAWRLLQQTSLASAAQDRSLDVSFLQGVGLQFVNIKAWMLALTVTAGWVLNANGQAAPNPGERLAITAGLMAFFAFSSNFTYALAGSLLRGWLETGNRLRWFNRGLALVLAATGAWMLTV